MNKLWLIFKREYLTRVKKRSFILATILTPLAFALFFVIVGFISAYESDTSLTIAVVDEGNILKERKFRDEKGLYYQYPKKGLEELRKNFEENEYNGILYIPTVKEIATKKHTIYYYAEDQLSVEIASRVRRQVRRRIRDYKIEELNLDKMELDKLETDVDLDPEPIIEGEEDASSMSGVIGMIIGGVLGIIMYMAL
ncbi:MAG: ABC transporter permease, partial [Bacteroidota bacterium]